MDYAVQVVRRTRTDDAILVGAGPRASQALLRAARAWAALAGARLRQPRRYPRGGRCRCWNIVCCCGPNRNWKACVPPRCWTAFCTKCRCRDENACPGSLSLSPGTCSACCSRSRCAQAGKLPVVCAGFSAMSCLPHTMSRVMPLSFAPTSRLCACGRPGGSAGCGRGFALASPSLRCAMLALVAAWDAIAAAAAGSLRITCPETVRLTKDVAAACRSPSTSRLARAACHPPRVATAAGRAVRPRSSKTPSCPPALALRLGRDRRRARRSSRCAALYLEAPSPFGLWLARAERALDCSFRVYPNLRDRSTAALFLRTAKSACACIARWAKAANSTTCANTCPATDSRTSTGRPPRGASSRW